MHKIKVYKDEIDIAEQVAKNFVTCDVIYISDKNVNPKELLQEIKPNLVTAEDNDAFAKLTDDVMPFSAILVTNIWNKNDAIFTASEIINAYETPRYKPINWGHKGSETRGNENIGVMVRTTLLKGGLDNLSPVEASEHKNISTNSTDATIHIREDGIVWSSYFPSYAANITKGIEEGNLYVSMECLFKDFGYGLRDTENGPIRLINRNEENASYSKNLRCFGGDGTIKIDGKKYQIGRWLQNITFSGMGIVNQPANAQGNKKYSIILANTNNLNEKPIYGYNSKDKNNSLFGVSNKMTELEVLQKNFDELTSKYDEAMKKIATFEETAVKQQIDNLTSAKTELETKNTELSNKVKSLETEVSTLNSTKTEFEKLTKEHETISAELNEIRATESARSRLNELKSLAGDRYTDADLDDLKKMNQDTFDAVKNALVKAGVSGLAKSTDQTVSGQAKSTDQTVSSQTKSTEASYQDEASKAVTEATVDTKEIVPVNTTSQENPLAVAQQLVSNLMNRSKSKSKK